VTLVVVATLDSESQAVVVASLLRAHDIPHFIQGYGFGGLFPGPQIGSYNTRQLLVPQSCVDRARDLLADLVEESTEVTSPPQGLWPKLRLVVEALLLGWFIPRRR
jgi:hypothetical protein